MTPTDNNSLTPSRGSLGFFSPDYRIGADSVRLAWKAWLVPGVALMPVGVYVALLPFLDRHYLLSGKLLIALGVMLLLLGFRALIASRLWPPGVVVITREGVRWGGRRIAAAEIAKIAVACVGRQMRQGLVFQFKLEIDVGDLKPLTLLLGQSGTPVFPPVVRRLSDAIRALLPDRQAKPAGDVIRVGGRMTTDGNFVIEADPANQAALEELLARAPIATPPDDALSQWAPAGSHPTVLDEPLTEPTWKEHLTQGKVIERARYGNYVLVGVEPHTAARVMKYRWRLFVLPSEGAPPVMAVNCESSPFGTSAFGVHRGGLHRNYGAAPADLNYGTFRDQAKAILGEELLGIRAAI